MRIISLLLLCGSLSAAAPGYRTTGDNILKNGELKEPCWKPGVPHYWDKQLISKGGQAEVKLDGGGVLLYFTGPEYVDQIRFKQSLKLEKGKVYEMKYDYRSELNGDLKADATFWGTGVFMRAWWQVPNEKWTTVRGLFYMAENTTGDVILTMQNRSQVKLWYRNISVKLTDAGKDDIAKIIPPFKVHSVESEDVFILPDTRKTTANFIVNDFPAEQLANYRIEAEYYPDAKKLVKCKIDGIKIHVPVKDIAGGETQLIGKLYSKADNALVATARVTINRVAKLPEGMDFSQTAEVVLPDGKKFFPVGVYAGTGWDFSVAELAGHGFNVIHTYATNRRDVDKGDAKGRANNLKLLDDAQKAGVYVMVQLPHDYTEKAEDAGKIPSWLDVYKDHPALFGYYVDETRSIKNTPYPTIRNAYNAVRKHDPRHKWFSYEGPDPNLRDCMDAIIYNAASPSAVKLCMLNLGAEKPIIHCYGQRDFMAQDASSLDYNQSNFVMPVIWGARGIFYFTYRNLIHAKTNPQYAELKPRVLDTARRFGEISQAIVSGDPLPTWAKTVKISGPMEYKVFADKEATYIFCGVADGKQGKGALSFAAPAGKKLRDVLNDRPLDAPTLELAPGQARIIEVK